MFKKLNLKTLLVILAVVLGIYLIAQYTDDSERNFRSQLTTFTKEKVNRIVYTKKGDDANTVTLRDVPSGWELKQGEKTFAADTTRVARMINQLYNLRAERVAAKRRDKWEKYEVTDSASTYVRMFRDDELLADIHLGKFSYTQPDQKQQRRMQQSRRRPRGKMTTFVRLAGEEPVYAVDGFLSMNFPKDANKLRNRSLVDASQHAITRVDLAGKYDYSLEKGPAGWSVNGNPADSATAASYVGILSTMNGGKFAEVDPETLTEPVQTAVIERANKEGITLKAYPAPQDEGYKYVINSSANEKAWFTSEKNLFTRIFKDKEHFLPEK